MPFDKFHHRLPAFRIGDRGHVAFGLVEHQVSLFFRTVEQLAVHADVVARGVGLRAQLGDDGAIHRNASLGDQLFGLAARCDAGSGNDLL